MHRIVTLKREEKFPFSGNNRRITYRFGNRNGVELNQGMGNLIEEGSPRHFRAGRYAPALKYR